MIWVVNVKEDSFLPSLNFVPTALKDIELILKGSSKPSNVASTFLNKLKPKMSPFLSKPLTSTNELAKGPEETEVKDYDVSQLSSLLQNTTTTADSDIVHKESIVFSEDENFNGSNIEVVFQHKPGKNGRTKSVEGFVSEHPIERVQFDPADKSESQITR